MILCYVKFSSLIKPPKKDEIQNLRWALVGNDVDDVIRKASEIGNDPSIYSGPFQLSSEWR